MSFRDFSAFPTEAVGLNYSYIVINNVSVLLSYWDRDKICRFANKAHYDWFGKNLLIEAQQLNFKKILGTGNRGGTNAVREVLEGHKSKFKQSFSSPDGTLTPCLVTLQPYWLNNQVEGFTVQIVPITNELVRNAVKLISKDNFAMNQVAEYLNQNIFRPFLGIQELSELHFISSAKLKRDFKKTFQTTPFAYFRDQQMQFAAKQLDTHLANKKELAEILNFANPSNFYQCYKRYKSRNQ